MRAVVRHWYTQPFFSRAEYLYLSNATCASPTPRPVHAPPAETKSTPPHARLQDPLAHKNIPHLHRTRHHHARIRLIHARATLRTHTHHAPHTAHSQARPVHARGRLASRRQGHGSRAWKIKVMGCQLSGLLQPARAYPLRVVCTCATTHAALLAAPQGPLTARAGCVWVGFGRPGWRLAVRFTTGATRSFTAHNAAGSCSAK